MKTYCGNPNSIADSILELLYDHKLCAEITKKPKTKLETNTTEQNISRYTLCLSKSNLSIYGWKTKREIEQERAQKTKKAKNTENEITNLLSFKKRQAYA